MRIGMNKPTITNSQITDPVVTAGNILQLYRAGTLELNKSTEEDFRQQVINPLKSKVASYCIEFNMASKSYLRNHSTLSKMANVILNPTSGTRSQEIIGITNKNLNDRKRSTQQMLLTMQKGHSLLLDIRSAFTGTTIDTKIIVQADGKIYSISEKNLNMATSLSAYGGGAVSNPFSLAYDLDKEILKTREFLDNAEEISNSEIWNKIFSLKPDYLTQYKTPFTKRIYRNYYFDSKDAEIYEHYLQNNESVASLTVPKYAEMRAKLGGGGGYASPFYKIGDIGSTQIKFFNFKDGQKKSVVNFARFSLLRDKFRELYNILDQDNITTMGQQLKSLFTEQESRVVEGVSSVVNSEAQKIFDTIFKL